MVIREIATAAEGTAKWAAPILTKNDVDSQLEKALKRSDVNEAYLAYSGNPNDFKTTLRGYIERENLGNYNLEKTARMMDSFNKATVPIDSALDYFSIMGGVGTAARGLKTLASLPGYLLYDMYYLGKTGDLIGTLKNIGYEGISWLMLGSLPHLLNHYTAQERKYVTDTASDKFMKALSERPTVEKATVKGKGGKGAKRDSIESLANAA